MKTSFLNGGDQYGGGNLATSLDWGRYLTGSVSFDVYCELPQGTTQANIIDASYKPAFMMSSEHPNSFVSDWDGTDKTLRVGGARLYASDSAYTRDIGQNEWTHVEIFFDDVLRGVPVDVYLDGVNGDDWYGGDGGGYKTDGDWSRVRDFDRDNLIAAFSNMDTWFIQFECKTDIAHSGVNIGIRNVQLNSGAEDGDCNLDGMTTDLDVSILAGNWQVLSGMKWVDADFNNDGMVTDLDVSLLAGKWQDGVPVEGAPVPEPGTLVLLITSALGLLACGRRRR